MSPAVSSQESYHHGDLRRTLLDTAAGILAETGRWDFSLREVARCAGVSHNAPYRHFADKDALLAAVAAAGFDALNAKTAAAAEGLTDPAAVLRALGLSYIRFGIVNVALYRLMFGQGLPNVEGLPPALKEAIEAARFRLREVIVWGARTGTFAVDPDDADAVTAAVVASWSLVHGFTSLTIDQVVEREVGQDTPTEFTMQVIDRFISGLLPHPDQR